MNQSHLVLVIFVATMVCNGNCRPREVDVKNIYPVYRSVKQLELETPNRYEKPFNKKRDDDSVTYLRIDIPNKNVNDVKTSEEIAIKNNSNAIIDYVPVALTVKKSNIKKWPSDQNGIESPDDLSLYNIYTNNINPLSVQHVSNTHHDLSFPYTPHSKPSILILEELTTPRPFIDYPDSVFSQPIQIVSRPPLAPQQSFPIHNDPVPSYPPTTRPLFTPVDLTEKPRPIPIEVVPYPYTPYPQQPTYTEESQYYPVPSIPTTHNPILPTYVEPVHPPVPTPVSETTNNYVSTTPQTETTTKKKKNKCPNVSIMATTSINNNNNLYKEDCQDIDIQINTVVNNSNIVRPSTPPNGSVVVVQNDQSTQTGVYGVFDVLWSILSRFFNFTFLNSFFNALGAGGAGISALFFPWLFPFFFLGGRKRLKKQFVVLGTEGNKPTESIYRSNNDSHNLKRTTRDLGKLHSPYHGWGIDKKISSSVSPTTEVNESKKEIEEQIAKQIKEPKINIESIATVARASSDGPSLPSSAAIGQMIDTVSQMVESDIRTPPKLKEIIKEKTNEQRKDALGEHSTPLPYTFIYDDEVEKGEGHYEMTDQTLHVDSSEGKASNINVKIATDEGVKGIAIPVMMDDMDLEPTAPPKKLQKIPEVPKPGKDDKKKNAVTKPHPTTTPSSGLSTWILLSDNKDVTTPPPKKNNNNKKEGNDEKKKASGPTPTTKKPVKIQATTLKSTTYANKKVTLKGASTASKKSDTDPNTMSALEAMVKNQKKTVTTTMKPKTTEEVKLTTSKKPTDPKKKFPDRLEVAETKDKVEIELPESKKTYTLPPNLQITTEDKAVATTTAQTNSQTTTENSVEGTTKKKSTTKKKKKNKNRRRKPADDTGVEAKIPQQAVGSQIYNFLSREIVPTVGLGLIGVALTAGLASFLGYNPFVSSTVPLRRTYDTHHGYSPNNYYNYNTDYGDGGQSEEVLFREVLSGMPEDSRYGLTHTATSYPDAYNRQDQVYDTMKNPVYSSATGSMYNSEKDMGNYDANYPQDYSSGYGTSYETQDKKYSQEVKDKYPVYNRETGTSFVYPETTGMTSAEKSSRNDYATQSSTADKYAKGSSDTIERQPEALYRVASDSDLQYRNGESTIKGVTSQSSWHRIGSPMDSQKPFPHLEPGPRSLDLSKVEANKKRTKRNTESVIQRISRKRTKKENDVENEIDFEDTFSDTKNSEQNLLEFSSTASSTKTTTAFAEAAGSTETDFSTTIKPKDVMTSTTEESKEGSTIEPTDSYESSENESTAPTTPGVSVMDVLKRLAQFKLRLGLNFLRSTTDMFSRYLDDIQRRVDESFANTTTTTVQYNRRKNPWSGFFFSRLAENESYRKKRSVLDDNQFLGAMLTEEDKINDRFSKTTKKDLRPSDKIFHQKKTAPKKYDSKRTN